MTNCSYTKGVPSMRSINLFFASLLILCSLLLFQNCSGNQFDPASTNTEQTNQSSLDADTLLKREFCDAVPICAAPPEGCHYEYLNKLPGALCASGCGELVCGNENPPKPPICPKPFCPAYSMPSPESKLHCEYKPSPIDENGCDSGCGDFVCYPEDPLPPVDPPVCKPIMCPMMAPIPNDPNQKCYFEQAPIDINGCASGCGRYVCEPIIDPPSPPPEEPIICPEILCAAPRVDSPYLCEPGPVEINPTNTFNPKEGRCPIGTCIPSPVECM